jgi:hypothetical protein
MNENLILSLPLLLAAGCATGLSGNVKEFDVDHRFVVKVPDGSKNLRMWVTMPMDDPSQAMSNVRVEAPAVAKTMTMTDGDGNRFLYLEVTNPKPGSFAVGTTYRVRRQEVVHDLAKATSRPLTDAERQAMTSWLQPSTHVVIDDAINELAKSIVGDEKDPLRAAHKIYDWMLDDIEYWVKDPKNKKASKVGSSDYCMTTKTGNCTDFHSLYAALAMAAGIPTRIKYGSLFKPSLDGQDQDQSYHCWIEFWTPATGWVPNDVAVADIYHGSYPVDDSNQKLVVLTTALGYDGPSEERVRYYFGSLDNRRVAWSVGRDLVLTPAQDAGPVNAMAKAYVEIDKAPFEDWTRKLTYREVPRSQP